MADKTHCPHDHFFRKSMQHKKVSREFFLQHLPENIKAIINLHSLKLKKESFISEKLRSQYADLLFSAEFNKKSGYIYLLLEHQSTPDELMPLRLLKYMLAIIDQHLITHKTKVLPLIYPMVLYTGKQKYNYSTDLFDLFAENKNLAKEVLLHPHQLINLAEMPDEELEQFIWHGIMMRSMKNIYEKDILIFCKSIINYLKIIKNEDEFGYINTVLYYLFTAGNLEDAKGFESFVSEALAPMKSSEENTMTPAEYLINKGKKEGRQEGVSSVARRMLESGLSPHVIAEYTKLSLTELAALKG